MFYQIFGPRGSGDYDYNSGAVVCRFLIVLIFLMGANTVISAAGEKRKIGVCLIVLGGLSLGVLCGYILKGVTEKTGWHSRRCTFRGSRWAFCLPGRK